MLFTDSFDFLCPSFLAALNYLLNTSGREKREKQKRRDEERIRSRGTRGRGEERKAKESSYG